MHKSSLLEIIRTFTPKELTKFEDFVNSPYFNKNKNVINLFNEIKKYAPEFIDEDLKKESAWKKLFPGKEYNYGIMKNIIFDLNKLCESYILQEHYYLDSFRNEYEMIEAIAGRNIQKLTSAKIDQFEKKVKNELELNKYTIIEDFLLTASHYNFAKENFIHQYNLKEDKSESIKLASDYLLYCFLVNSFKLINNTFSHELQGNPSMNKTLLEKFFIKLKEHSILEDILLKENNRSDRLSKIINCFYYMYNALTSEGNIDEYNKFKYYLKENVDLFSAFELQNLNNCRVVCFANLKLPYLKSAKENLEWLKFLMGKGALLERSGLITFYTMRNLVTNAVDLKEIEFAEQFIEKYSDKLPEDSRNNTYNYCMSVINFGKREFGKALEYLSRISNEKLMLKYDLKKIYLKIYYELDDHESFEYAFDSFAHFKKRNKLANESRVHKFNMFSINIKSLFKLKTDFDEFASVSLRNEIMNNTGSDRIWLLEKLDELEKANKKSHFLKN